VTTIQNFLEAKYGDGGPGSDRFEPDPQEIHASSVSVCQRKHFYRSTQGRVNEASPYFELGRMFEMLYGAALAFEHDDTITPQVLVDHHPWEVAEKSKWVQQDVTVTIELEDGPDITGEADWCVLNEPCILNGVTLHADGTRTEDVGTAQQREYRDTVAKVVETKTTKDLSWKKANGADEKHKFQVYPYMKCFDSEAEIVYMQRNDWDEYSRTVELSDAQWMDVELRVRKLSEVMQQDKVPAATPLEESACKWCSYKDDCRAAGGSRFL